MRMILFFLILLLSSCNNNSVPEHEKIANKITALTAKKIEKETGLRLIGIGGGMTEHIRMMSLSFNCFNKISIEQGRTLLIYCANEYLSAVNSNEKIRPYLSHHPFNYNDIEIRIFIYKPDHTDVPIDEISVIAAYGGSLAYKIRQSGPVILKRIHEETYEEALKALETVS